MPAIRRPIFAGVCSFIILLLGVIAIPTLPIERYPQLAAPQVTVSAVYTGASAEVVETAVTVPLEQQINGVEGMRYIQSVSGNDGTSSITMRIEQVDADQPVTDLTETALTGEDWSWC